MCEQTAIVVSRSFGYLGDTAKITQSAMSPDEVSA